MKRPAAQSEEACSRPERVLLILARYPGDCRGKALRFQDGSEFRFDSLEELTGWLLQKHDETDHQVEQDKT